MKPIVIRYRVFWLVGVIVLLGCGTVAFLLRENGEPGFPFLLIGGAFAAFFGILGARTDEFSEAGIRVGSEGRKRFYPWDQVMQAGIFMVSYQNTVSPYLAFTFAGGRPRTHGQKLHSWRVRNRKTSLYVPASEPLRALVLRHYGPLDFDLSNGGPEQSTVVD